MNRDTENFMEDFINGFNSIKYRTKKKEVKDMTKKELGKYILNKFKP